LTVGSVAVAYQPPTPRLPVPDPAVQTAYENELADFLTTTSQPDASTFAATVEGRNAYWAAMAEWWQAVPWDAVSGQWGCATSVHTVAFNPPDDAGVIVATHGEVATCGGFVLDNPEMLIKLETRTSMLRTNPDLLEQLGQ
jgi:hypothetical protein